MGSIISFHHTKPIGFGEGGAIIVDRKYSDIVRKIINFGIGLEEKNYFYKYGNNYKMSDISAIYIIQHLNNNLNIIINKHSELLNYFKEKMIKLKIDNFKLFPSFNDDNKITLSCFSLIFNKYDDNIRIRLLENNIFCRKYYHPLKDTENATNLFNNILCLPCNKDLTFKDIDNIFEIILKNE